MQNLSGMKLSNFGPFGSDGSGLGLSPKPARPRRFLGGPSPPEARSSKPESPAGFFGPKIGQIPAEFEQNYGIFCNNFFFNYLWAFLGHKSADFRPNSGKIIGFFVTEFFFKFFPKFLNKKIGAFYALKKPK